MHNYPIMIHNFKEVGVSIQGSNQLEQNYRINSYRGLQFSLGKSQSVGCNQACKFYTSLEQFLSLRFDLQSYLLRHLHDL